MRHDLTGSVSGFLWQIGALPCTIWLALREGLVFVGVYVCVYIIHTQIHAYMYMYIVYVSHLLTNLFAEHIVDINQRDTTIMRECTYICIHFHITYEA